MTRPTPLSYPGSSPLARGLLGQGTDAAEEVGIIPARAGFTHPSRARSSPRTDHPRSRGVYGGVNLKTIETDGSSPLARGLQGPSRHPSRRGGIIPARAGFTPIVNLCWSSAADHPRSRGVYLWPGRTGQRRPGSSPLARGLHLRILGIPTTSHTTRPRLPSLPT